MDVYRYFAEDENDRFIFLFTYQATLTEVLMRLESIIGCEPYVYDVFPEPYQETVELEDILSVLTKDGVEMFIPQGLEVNYFSVARILFGMQ